jgi:CTP synthase
MTKYIFILGGVISGLGKGVTSGSIGAILKEMGLNVTIKKLDPYLNVDPGTLNPIEHGEVYVTKDGGETDLDLGYYERFAEIEATKNNSTSSGKLMFELLKKERKGDFLGKTITMIPHFTNTIKNFICADSDKYDVIICEIGGSAGDYEANAFLESIRQIKQENENDAIICFLSYLVYYQASKELKTKPTQVGLRQLMSAGLETDLIFLRSEYEMSDVIKEKVALYGNVKKDDIIAAYNVSSIYQVPLEYKKEGLIERLRKKLNIKEKKIATFDKWTKLNNQIVNLKHKVTLGLVGKYVELEDAYYSVIEAIKHAGWYYSTKIDIVFINARIDSTRDINEELKNVDCILVPGGFGTSGIEEIIKAITYARENLVPYMGICLGMQLAVVEFARNMTGIKNASSSEFGRDTNEFVVDLMTEWKTDDKTIEKRDKDEDKGGTLRLGSYDTVVSSGSLANKIYESTNFKERHRHRYEVDIKYKEILESKGMIFSGLSPDGKLPEIVEINEFVLNEKTEKHPYFIAGQFHPEFNSSPFNPHPMFKGLIKAALDIKFKERIN